MFDGPLGQSIIGRARERGLLDLIVTDIRDFATDRHRTVDDTPYGGGPGMVMATGPLSAAIESVKVNDSWTIFLSPQGRVFNQSIARELSDKPRLLLVCGHYEGIDERERELFSDNEISIGDYVLTGGELP